MPALEDVAPYLGYTMIAIPNAGKVMEVDKAGNIRWQITGLASPFHAQMLRGDRVLIAEATQAGSPNAISRVKSLGD